MGSNLAAEVMDFISVEMGSTINHECGWCDKVLPYVSQAVDGVHSSHGF